MPGKPSNTLDLVFMYYLWHNFLICPFQVELTIFVLIALSFRLISVYSSIIPARSGTILVHSVSFRRHSGSFRYIPFRSIPFLCLVTPVSLGRSERGTSSHSGCTEKQSGTKSRSVKTQTTNYKFPDKIVASRKVKQSRVI